jgi:hypothetical protein
MTTRLLQKILVDPLSQLSVDAHLDTELSKAVQPTDTCELEPAEDSFLELGKTNDDIPEPVAKWDASNVLLDPKLSTEIPARVHLVGQKKSVAWFELVLQAPSLTEHQHVCRAIPLALQIQVGDGSWESSLIQSHTLEGGSKDFVSFDLVIMWHTEEDIHLYYK